MPTNAEFKAELRDLTLARHIARSLGGLPVETVDQTDTYYRVASGRLKRREVHPVVASPGPGAVLWGADIAGDDKVPGADGSLPRRIEYIHYHRSNDPAVRDSDYLILDERALRTRFGAAAPGNLDVWVTVRKRREIWLVRDTAVHLDDVEGLGRFLEFEAVVRAGLRTVEEARTTVAGLQDAFGPSLGEPVSGSYSDLLASGRE